MKALEKAAKDREENDAAPTPEVAKSATAGAALAASELSLEPLPQSPANPHRDASPARDPAPAPRQPGRAASDTAGADTRDTAQAATLVRAGQREEGGGIGAYVREHPLMVFGTLASMFLIGYGIYVYLQMTNPTLFNQQPRLAQPAPIAPPPAAPAPVSGTSTIAAQQPLSTALVLPSQVAGNERPAQQAPPSAGAAAAPSGTAASSGTAAPSVAGTPAPRGSMGPAGAPAAAGTATSAPVPAPPAAPAPRENIRVLRGGPPPSLSPVLAEAFRALDSGNLDASQRLYNQVLQGDPGNIDALLGGAAIASQRGDSDSAASSYMKVLQIDPRNTLAQAGLIGMLGRADPLAAETRVKQLIGRDPSAYLYFTLGNVYVDQNRWPDAQHAYFQAHHLQPDNPDYAYNLAVGLEHVGQPKLALNFYRRATQLAAAKGRANFSTGAALERISQLERVVE